MDINQNEQFDFTKFLPLQITEDILINLDILSLRSATEVCSSWNFLINNSNYVWRKVYFDTLQRQDNVCVKNLNELNWKELAIQRHLMLIEKLKWIRGDFSYISADNDCKIGSNKFIFSKNDWGDILQQELDR